MTWSAIRVTCRAAGANLCSVRPIVTTSHTGTSSTSLGRSCARSLTTGTTAIPYAVQRVCASFSTTSAAYYPDRSSFGSASTLRLRPYQVDCVSAVLDTLRQGQYTRLGVSSPTGSGKTSMFTALIRLLPPIAHKDGTLATQVMILVGSVVLAQQAADSVKRAWPDLSVQIEQGNNRASGLADVTVATYQTLARSDFVRLAKFDPSRFKAVIIDEAHHSVAPSYLRILEHFDPRIGHHSETASPMFIAEDTRAGLSIDEVEAAEVLPSDLPNGSRLDLSPSPATQAVSDAVTDRPCVPLIGFTATFSRADDLALGAAFERIVWHAEWLDMIRGRWLSPLRFTTLNFRSILDLRSVKTSSSGDYNTLSLAQALNSPVINRQIVLDWQERAGDSRSTLVFAVNIDHVLALTNAFRTELGVEAAFVHEGIRQSDREILYERFRSGEIRVLVNCGILTEGADFPAIDCVLLCRPTRSRNLFLQMIGRGLRLSPDTGKRDCLVIDLVGNYSRGLVCAPTLFGLDPAQQIESQTTDNLEEMGQKQAARDEERDAEVVLRYQNYATIFDLVQDLDKKPISIRNISQLAWVGTGEGLVLELPGKGYVRIGSAENGKNYAADFYRRLPRHARTSSPYARPDRILEHGPLGTMVANIDRLVQSDPRMKPDVGIRHSAPWRFRPSTASQQARVLKVLAPPREEDGFEQRTTIDAIWVSGGRAGERVPVSSLTAGQASDLICRLVHGGLSSMRKLKKQADKRWLKGQEERAIRSQARSALRSPATRNVARS